MKIVNQKGMSIKSSKINVFQPQKGNSLQKMPECSAHWSGDALLSGYTLKGKWLKKGKERS